MNRVEQALRQTAAALNKRDQTWALVGGFAVADDNGAEELVRALMGDGYSFSASVEHDNGRLATVRLRRAVEGIDVLIDLLFASSGIEPEIAEAADQLEVVPGLTLPVATTGHLIALKLLARDDDYRPQDLADLRELFAAATPSDVAVAREAVGLITARGFNRYRDLTGALEEFLKAG